jgi:Flp pilus assembly pilin Flp
MIRLAKNLKNFLNEEDGSEAVEYLLLMLGVIIPLAAMMYKISEMIAQYYSYCSWLIYLPFP